MEATHRSSAMPGALLNRPVLTIIGVPTLFTGLWAKNILPPLLRAALATTTLFIRSQTWLAMDIDCGKLNMKSRPSPDLAGEVDSTIMHVHSPEGHRKADAGTARLGGDVELEDPLP